jgi:hypothetical protein
MNWKQAQQEVFYYNYRHSETGLKMLRNKKELIQHYLHPYRASNLIPLEYMIKGLLL